METVYVIRHKHFVEGQSVRRIAREMGLHRLTVQKYLQQTEPQRGESVARSQPVMGVVGARIEALLEEWAPRLGGKHRLTSPRVHRQLREEGFTVGERTVRQFLAEKRRQAAEVYIPLVHRPGDEACPFGNGAERHISVGKRDEERRGSIEATTSGARWAGGGCLIIPGHPG